MVLGIKEVLGGIVERRMSEWFSGVLNFVGLVINFGCFFFIEFCGVFFIIFFFDGLSGCIYFFITEYLNFF